MKKDFETIQNPALSFLSPQEAQQEQPKAKDEQTPAQDVNALIKANKPEYKTKRVELLCKPSVIKALDKIAKSAGISRNELISVLLERYLADGGKL